jgi:hypothetical protein
MATDPRSYALGPVPWQDADAWVLDMADAPDAVPARPPTLLRLQAAGSTGLWPRPAAAAAQSTSPACCCPA